MNRDLVWPGVVAASTVAMTVVVTLDLGPPIAPIIALWFVGVCPGLPYIRLLGLREPLTVVLLAIALSLSLQAVVSLALLRGSTWTPVRMLQFVIAITVLGVFLDAQRAIWGRRSATSAGNRRIAPSRPTSTRPRNEQTGEAGASSPFAEFRTPR